MKEFKETVFCEERALFGENGCVIDSCTFERGESPVKECSDLDVRNSLFKWKYPFWYCKNIHISGSTLFEGARAGIWYSDGIYIKDSQIQAPKTFRRARNIVLDNVVISKADETLWNCCGIKLKNVSARGDYLAMNSSDIEVDGLILDGNYSFDGAKNVVIRNSKLVTKDAFWNSESITVYDSFISGEYLGWNAKDLTLINCTIDSLQGMCYIENLKLVNCKLNNVSLAFEYSSVDAESTTSISSVFNPKSGQIKAPKIGKLIVQSDKVDPEKTLIECDNIEKISDKVDWEEIL